MSDNALPQDAAGDGADAPAIHDDATALAALKGLLSTPDDAPAADTQSDAQAPDAGQDDPATGDEGGQGEPDATETPAATAIEPPASWSTEEKASFAQLPPDLQAVVSRRESERDKLITQRTQEIAEQRKAAEAERAAVQTQLEQSATSLQQLMHLAVPELQQFAQISPDQWQRLSVENPAEYVRLSAARDALRGRVDALQGEWQRVQQQTEAQRAQQINARVAEESRLLREKIPEFADPAKAEKLTQDLRSHLAHYGYTPEEIAQAVDHRSIVVAQDAMRWRQYVSARKDAEAKRAPSPAPAVQRPGVPVQIANAEKQLEAEMSRLVKTNSERDALAVLKRVLR